MARTPIREKDILNPERIALNVIKDYIDGKLDNNKIVYTASVVKIDHVGGQLPTEDSPEDPPNPKNSILGRVIDGSRDDIITEDEDLDIFYPMFSHDIMPIKEGEHVYVMYVDEWKEHCLWLGRVKASNDVENPNLVPGKQRFEDNTDNDLGGVSPEQAVQDLNEDPGVAEVNENFSKQDDVPPYTARVGERCIGGSNNAMIVVGSDRPEGVDSGVKEKSGTIDLVAGRQNKEDMSTTDDLSRVYVSEKTEIDKNFGTDGAGEDAGEAAGVGIISDEVRIVARAGTKIVTGDGNYTFVIDKDGKMTIEAKKEVEIRSDADVVIESAANTTVKGTAGMLLEAPKIEVGATGAAEPLVLGTQLTLFVQDFMNLFLSPTAATWGDIQGIPIPQNAAVAAAYGAFMAKWGIPTSPFLSKVHKVDK